MATSPLSFAASITPRRRNPAAQFARLQALPAHEAHVSGQQMALLGRSCSSATTSAVGASATWTAIRRSSELKPEPDIDGSPLAHQDTVDFVITAFAVAVVPRAISPIRAIPLSDITVRLAALPSHFATSTNRQTAIRSRFAARASHSAPPRSRIATIDSHLTTMRSRITAMIDARNSLFLAL